MSKTTAPNPGTRYHGLRNTLTDMMKRNPDRAYDIGQLRKSFKGVSESALAYHLSQLKTEKLIDNPKRGFYQWTPGAKTVEEIRAEIAKQTTGLKIETSTTGFAYGKQNGITAKDTFWVKLLHQSIEGLLVRTASKAPAHEVFTDQDRDLLRELLTIATGERSASMDAMKAKETVPV
jgi:hypothetical protein